RPSSPSNSRSGKCAPSALARPTKLSPCPGGTVRASLGDASLSGGSVAASLPDASLSGGRVGASLPANGVSDVDPTPGRSRFLSGTSRGFVPWVIGQSPIVDPANIRNEIYRMSYRSKLPARAVERSSRARFYSFMKESRQRLLPPAQANRVF